MWRGLNTDEVAEPNAFAVTAAVAAFTKGGRWLDELREYLAENKRIAREFIKENIRGIHVVPSEATYLLWLDCGGIENFSERGGEEYIREQSGLYLSSGAQYGGESKNFLRMNIACTRENLKDGLNRLASVKF